MKLKVLLESTKDAEMTEDSGCRLKEQGRRQLMSKAQISLTKMYENMQGGWWRRPGYGLIWRRSTKRTITTTADDVVDGDYTRKYKMKRRTSER